MESQFGTTSYEGGGESRAKHHRILTNKDGSLARSIFRIVPPILGNRDTGKIVQYEPKHWGYYGVSGKDPTKGVPRTFLCPKEVDYRNRDAQGKFLVKVPCNECDMIERLSQEREALCLTRNVKKNDRLAALHKLPPAEQQRVRLLDEILDGREQGTGAHKVDNKRWKINVIWHADQTAGDLGLSSAQWNSLKARRGEEATKPGLIDQSFARRDKWDPVAPDQGRWIVCDRTGFGFDTKDKFYFLSDTKQVPGGEDGEMVEVQVPLKAPITDQMAKAIETGCRDLSDCSPSYRLTAGQVSDLVHLFEKGQNDPEAVDEVMGVKRREPARNTIAVPSQNYRGDEGAEDEEVPDFVPPAPTTPALATLVAQATPTQAAPKVEAVPAATVPKPVKLRNNASAVPAMSTETAEEVRKFLANNPGLVKGK